MNRRLAYLDGRFASEAAEEASRTLGPGQNVLMDAGLAALLGAAVGSLATLGAALVNGRAAARSQFGQWRRQHRRDAYAAYLSALHDRDIAMDAILDGLRPDRADAQSLDELDERVRRFVTLAREVHRTAEVVVLEGPSVMAEAADHVAGASGDLSVVMQRMVKNAHTGDLSHQAAETALAAERGHVLYQAVKSFRFAARDTLSNPS